MKATLFCVSAFLTNVACAGNPDYKTYFNRGFSFTENKGQVVDQAGTKRNDILYTGDGVGGIKIFFQQGKISYVISEAGSLNEKQEGEDQVLKTANKVPVLPASRQQTVLSHRIDVEFMNGNPTASLVTSNQTESPTNYHLAHCREGLTARSFQKLMYKDIYPNVDILFKGGQPGGLEYDIVLKPGANPADIKIKYTGADELQLEKQKLIIKTSLGEITEYIPEAFQMINGKKVNVKAEYRLHPTRNDSPAGGGAGGEVSFQLSAYNLAYPVIIDPWATYFGAGNGHSITEGWGIITDQPGNAIVTGYTSSVNFPVTAGAFQSQLANPSNNGFGPFDLFIAKFDVNGNLLWSTYYGGSAADTPYGIATDNSNNILITGTTASSDFPITSGAFQTAPAGAFIIKLDGNGNRLWATYCGGATDVGNGITTDHLNNVLVTGNTNSANFPVTSGAFQKNLAGKTDAFIAKFDGNGNPIWATYYGGSSFENAYQIATDNLNNVVVTGNTSSFDIPVNPGAFQGSLKGSSNAFAVKFDGNGNELWATYYGGSNVDIATGVATDNLNNVVITGATNSFDFPVSAGAFQTALLQTPSLLSLTMGNNVFIVQLDSLGNRRWATYFRAEDELDDGNGVAIDLNSNIYITGFAENSTMSTTACAFHPQYGGGPEDAFIAKFDSVGNLTCSSYVGGDGYEDGGGWKSGAVNGKNVYMIGSTSGDFPVTSNGFQTNYGGEFYNSFIIELCSATCGADNAIKVSVGANITINTGTSVKLNPNTTGNYNYYWSPSSGLSCTDCKNPMASPTVTTTYYLTLNDTTNDCNCGISGDSVTIAVVSNCSIYIPDAFSPNGDGVNDVFSVYIPSCINPGNYTFQVFDRWGEKVFSSNDPKKGWDGTYNGKEMDNDVFIYVLTYSANNAGIVHKGNVSLIK